MNLEKVSEFEKVHKFEKNKKEKRKGKGKSRREPVLEKQEKTAQKNSGSF